MIKDNNIFNEKLLLYDVLRLHNVTSQKVLRNKSPAKDLLYTKLLMVDMLKSSKMRFNRKAGIKLFL